MRTTLQRGSLSKKSERTNQNKLKGNMRQRLVSETKQRVPTCSYNAESFYGVEISEAKKIIFIIIICIKIMS